MHTHILGLGSIGCLIAHHLRRAVHPKHVVTLIHSGEQRALEAEHIGKVTVEHAGVSLTAEDFRHEVFPRTYPSTLEQRRALFREARNHAKIQTLVVCTKAHQTLPAIGSLYSRISPHTTIVLLQNGMGTLELLNAKLFKKPKYRPNYVLATNTHGAWRKGTLHTVHAGVGEISLGIVQPEGGERDFERSYPDLNVDDIVPTLDPRLPPEMDEREKDLARRYRSVRMAIETLTSIKALNVSWRPMREVDVLMRRKLVVNSVINPLTALMNCQNGSLFQHAEARAIAQSVCREACGVFFAQWQHEIDQAKFAGHELPFTPFPKELQRLALMEECNKVAKATGANYSSMLMDMRNGEGTEISSLNGYLVNLGGQFGREMNTNRMLMNLVQLRTKIPLTGRL
jgi:2-dehydropantoate 2-reductase